MAPLTLVFQPLPNALNDKTLQAWRKDAGWTAPVAPPPPKHPRAVVQWVTVESGKNRVGIARLELAPPEFCYVADLIIASKFRRRGVGSWFLRAIEQYVAGHGIKRLLLQAEAGTEAFYASKNFVTDPFVSSFLKKDLPPLQRKILLNGMR